MKQEHVTKKGPDILSEVRRQVLADDSTSWQLGGGLGRMADMERLEKTKYKD